MKHIMLLLLLLILTSCTYIEPPELMTKHKCEAAGGYWNECGSACTGTDYEYCIEVCVQKCECDSAMNYVCPENYKCLITKDQKVGVCTLV